MKVLICGAGLSGMVLATALKKAGAEVDIIEIHPQWDVLGVGISVQGPALRALKSIGLLDRCIAGGFGYSQVVNCDQDGNVQGIVDLPRLNGAQRCRIVVENSRQLGEWEKTPDAPNADPTALISASMKALAAPI